MTTLSSTLREAIRQSQLPYTVIAAAVGISDGIISRFMREERSMNLATAEKLCAYLQLELREVQKRSRK